MASVFRPREALEEKADAYAHSSHRSGNGSVDRAGGRRPDLRDAWLQELYEQFAPVRDDARAFGEVEINEAIKAVRSKHA